MQYLGLCSLLSALHPFTGSLTALVCQHSITPLALPCKLLIPDRGTLPGPLGCSGSLCGVMHRVLESTEIQ